VAAAEGCLAAPAAPARPVMHRTELSRSEASHASSAERSPSRPHKGGGAEIEAKQLEFGFRLSLAQVFSASPSFAEPVYTVTVLPSPLIDPALADRLLLRLGCHRAGV